ncbi:hypothetical protein [Paenibacillus abyssi]|uniref:Uncharacterized protein n=1 Tax=Paenibacillus abyssi TaxID=1340531 RepID=A0A917CIM7_9BACL|nr:hypothetical protein [Paenibacillus abyssi]GGF88650.1 hypothetical protein GCM10010916_02460 [Paenibacillus abyssi]
MVSKTLLKRMVGEVSVPVLGGLLSDYSARITERDEVDADLLEEVSAIETILTELKARGGVKSDRQRRKDRAKPAEETPVIATIGGGVREPIRAEAGSIQR